MKKTLTFNIPSEKVLNANKNMHHMQKAKIVAYLRQFAAEIGIAHHIDIEKAQQRYETILQERHTNTEKSRTRKRLSKAGETEETILEELLKVEKNLKPELSSAETGIDFMFNFFKIRMIVCPPTRRKLDPPNLYPTLKALIDGFTDASWWADDNFTQLLEVSFRYGGLSGVPNVYKVMLEIEEVENIKEYILESEIFETGI